MEYTERQNKQEWSILINNIIFLLKFLKDNILAMIFIYMMFFVGVTHSLIIQYIYGLNDGWLIDKIEIIQENDMLNCITYIFIWLLLFLVFLKIFSHKAQYYRFIVFLTILYSVFDTPSNEWVKYNGNSYQIPFLAFFLIASFYEAYLLLHDLYESICAKLNNNSDNSKYEEKGFTTNANLRLQPTGRHDLVEMLLKRLSNTIVEEENYAVGICGSWGTGKTTFLEEIDKEAQKQFKVIRFNPWECSGKDQIVLEFFIALSEKSCKMNRKRRTFLQYAKMLSEIGVLPFYDKILDIIQDDSNTSLLKIKNEIKTILNSIEKKILIIIDDLDRLGSEELYEVLKLVRETANFPNLIFITAYDKEHVVKMLKSCNIDDGENYIKKIFSLEIRLPHFEDYTFPNALYRELELCVPEKYRDDLRSVIIEKDSDGNKCIFEKYLENFRDIYRFAAQFGLHIDCLNKNDVLQKIYIQDFFWLELLEYRYFNTYNLIFENSKNNLLEKIQIDSKSDRIKLKDNLEAFVGISPEEKFLLRKLFPDNTQDNEQIYGHIYDSYNFFTYFSFRDRKEIFGVNDYEKILTESKEDEISNYIEFITDKALINQKDNVIRYIPFYINTKDEIVKNNFVVLLSLVKYNDENIVECFRKFLKDIPSNLIDYCYSKIKSKIEEGDTIERWNLILTSLSKYEIIDINKTIIKYESCLSEEQLKQLSCLNFNKWIQSKGRPSIKEIGEEGSEVNHFLKNACACIKKRNNEVDKELLCLSELLKQYSEQWYSLSELPDDYRLSYDFDYDEEIVMVHNRIKDVFGNFESYKSFINTCCTYERFEQEKNDYYSEIQI